MRRRREAAETRKRKLRRAMEEGDDDGVIEELFSFQMEEVWWSSRALGHLNRIKFIINVFPYDAR